MELTKDELWAMDAVKDGADVYSLFIATRLRSVERKDPKLIHITEPMMAPANGAARQPYFGVILTAAGKRRLTKQEAGR